MKGAKDMKTYNNFCITWTEDGNKKEIIHFCKLDAIKEYINILTCERDVSSLKILGVTRKNFIPEDITSTVNRFLSN